MEPGSAPRKRITRRSLVYAIGLATWVVLASGPVPAAGGKRWGRLAVAFGRAALGRAGRSIPSPHALDALRTTPREAVRPRPVEAQRDRSTPELGGKHAADVSSAAIAPLPWRWRVVAGKDAYLLRNPEVLAAARRAKGALELEMDREGEEGHRSRVQAFRQALLELHRVIKSAPGWHRYDEKSWGLYDQNTWSHREVQQQIDRAENTRAASAGHLVTDYVEYIDARAALAARKLRAPALPRPRDQELSNASQTLR